MHQDLSHLKVSFNPKITIKQTKKCFIPAPPQKVRGSLPDLRHDCNCPRRYAGGQSALYRMHESSGSTDSLLEEADEFLRHCAEDQSILELNTSKRTNRRCSEADIQRGK